MPTTFLTAAEVAELLKLNVETVYSLVSKEGLPAAKLGGQWRFSESDVLSWVATKSVGQVESVEPQTESS